MPIAFGTSGLRAAADDFDTHSVAAYVAAFLQHLNTPPGEEVFIGCDLRASSPDISRRVVSAVVANGQTPRWCGVLPTPAIAAAALEIGVPAIVITGSHIPEDYNGIKFYRPDGEVLKDDEAPIRDRAAKALANGLTPSEIALPELDESVGPAYVARYVAAFGADALKGLKLGIFEHSAASRDLLVEIMSGLGAEIVPFGRSERFVAVDTEALDPDSVAVCAAQIKQNGLDAVVSTDGDGDRPLLIGADGRQVNGDVLCTLAAHALGIRTVVTPLTSTSAVELSGWFGSVIRTRIGSPYVVAAMQADGGASLAGFEANGGFLLGTPIACPAGELSALPTRDAVLPLVAVLAESNRRAMTLAALVGELPVRVMKADRLKQIPQAHSSAFLSEIASSAALRARMLPDLENPADQDLTDGVRFSLADGSVVHFRASGNAPELRAYVETASAEQTERTLTAVMAQMATVMSDWPEK